MTCAIPLLISPVCIDNQCFIDGGIICNYPLNYCIQSGKKEENMLGFKNKYDNDNSCVNSESNLLDFLLIFLFKAIFSLSTTNIQPSVKYEVICNANYLNINNLRTTLSNIEIRKDLFNNGIKSATQFLSKLEDTVKELI
jgi:predicted patatin/cPLA2 family phospholipase